MKKLVPVLLCLLSVDVNALQCRKNNSLGPVSEALMIPAIKIPSGRIQTGDRIWTSETQTMLVYCFDSQGGHNLEATGDQVAFWLFPSGAYKDDDLQFGVEYNNTSHIPLQTKKVNIPGFVIFPSTSPREPKAMLKSISYRVFIQAKRDIVARQGTVLSDDYFAIFQIDGTDGLNWVTGQNYRQRVTGLRNMNFISCNVKVRIDAPNQEVYFGSISLAQLKRPGAVMKRPFSVSVIKENSCSDQFGMDSSFDTLTAPLNDNYSLALQNGLQLQVYNPMTRRLEQFKSFTELTPNMTNLVETRNYEAWLSVSNMSQLKAGDFSGLAMFRVNYK